MTDSPHYWEIPDQWRFVAGKNILPAKTGWYTLQEGYFYNQNLPIEKMAGYDIQEFLRSINEFQFLMDVIPSAGTVTILQWVAFNQQRQGLNQPKLGVLSRQSKTAT